MRTVLAILAIAVLTFGLAGGSASSLGLEDGGDPLSVPLQSVIAVDAACSVASAISLTYTDADGAPGDLGAAGITMLGSIVVTPELSGTECDGYAATLAYLDAGGAPIEVAADPIDSEGGVVAWVFPIETAIADFAPSGEGITVTAFRGETPAVGTSLDAAVE